MAVALGLHQVGVVDILYRLSEREGGQLQLGPAGVKAGEGEQILHNVGHTVGFVENNTQEVLFRVGRELSCVVRQRLRIGADVGQGSAQLVGHVGHKLPAELLGLALLGYVVNDDKNAAQTLLVKGGEQKLQAAAAHIPLTVQVAGLLHGQHPLEGSNVGEECIVVLTAANGNGSAQHLLGGGVGLDNRAVPGEGHHTVGHMQKEGAQLGALVLHFFQGALELLGHVIEGAGEHADLVSGGHLDFVGKVAVRHPFSALGQPLNGGDQRLGQQEREKHGDDQAEDQRLYNQRDQLTVEGGHIGAVVLHIDDVAALAPLYCHGYVHIGGGGGVIVAGILTRQHPHQVAGIIGHRLSGLLIVGACQPVAVGTVQYVVFPAAVVNAEGAVGIQNVGDAGCGVLLTLDGSLQVLPEVRVAKGLGHLGIEVLRVVISNRIDQKCTYHRHQGDNQQRHDEHELHVQASKHGDTPSQFFQEMQRRPEPKR